MKSIRFLTFGLLLFLFGSLQLMAEPAHPDPIKVIQPDGSRVTLRLIGDEFFHYTATADGYTVVKNTAGGYEYAILNDGRLQTSGLLAHDAQERSQYELSFLTQVERNIHSANEVKQAKSRRQAIRQQQRPAPAIDYDKFRGLVVLINFRDKKFSMENPKEFYDDMLNTKDYQGFTHEGRFQKCTGSARDYYNDNSGGMFDPHFDVVGPIDVDYSCLEGNGKSREIFRAVMDAIDPQVDFSQYDADNDGTIDMVFFLVAGYSSNYVGNDSGYLWPHMGALVGYDNETDSYFILEYDNLDMWGYACSCEIYGWEQYGNTIPNGIGTFCHEFSHVLGLRDLYDTDGGESGGESNHPNRWSVMANGASFNYGRTPAAYTIYERYTLGFSQPREIVEPGEYSLDHVGTTGDGLILRTPVENEFFMFDNRQQVKWDTALPYHGLTVWRVDSTDEIVWWNNRVNANPEHNYFEMVRAGGTSADASWDPFPGKGNVTYLSPITEPAALVTWAKVPVEKTIKNIREIDGVISFTVVDGIESFSLGDVNRDGEVNIADLNVLIQYILSGTSGIIGRADINGDNEINIGDVNSLIDIILTQ